jgi:putative ABC transport system permease protein
VVRVRDGVDPVSLAAPIRQVVRGQDSLVAVQDLRPMADVVGVAIARERFISALVLVFAVSGVVLALVGVFGILAQAVQARWREMGIRLALGAQQGDVRRLILTTGLAVLGIGTAAGLVIAAGATRILGSILYDTSPLDIPTYVAVAALVIASGLVAAWMPAWRASRANPATTLRAD